MDELALKLWRALESAEQLLDHEDPGVRLKAIGAVASVGSTYAKVHPEARREISRANNPLLEAAFPDLLD